MLLAHLTSAHPRDDTRIWHKMCASLSADGYQVALVVADGKGSASINGVIVKDVGVTTGRLSRMIGGARKVFQQALELNADIYHLHDPELLPWGVLLRARGKRVIYDAHEDMGRDVLSKHYLPSVVRPAVAWVSELVERALTAPLSGAIGATSTIATKFQKRGLLAMDINNYPIASELWAPNENAEGRLAGQICYIGGIAEARGICELVDAMALTRPDATLRLAGEFAESQLHQALQGRLGWQKVEWMGQLDRLGVRSLLAKSVAGIVTLRPTPAYVEALPIKMFEYMSAGIPVVASDFPLWRSIIEGADCGLLVDPLDPAAIAGAIDWLIAHPEAAKEMGQRGKAAVLQRYNWDIESKKLADFYETVLTN